jgi:hypothetical protein
MKLIISKSKEQKCFNKFKINHYLLIIFNLLIFIIPIELPAMEKAKRFGASIGASIQQLREDRAAKAAKKAAAKATKEKDKRANQIWKNSAELNRIKKEVKYSTKRIEELKRERMTKGPLYYNGLTAHIRGHDLAIRANKNKIKVLEEANKGLKKVP